MPAISIGKRTREEVVPKGGGEGASELLGEDGDADRFENEAHLLIISPQISGGSLLGASYSV